MNTPKSIKRLSAALPPAGLTRQLSVVTLLQSIGSGVFLTSSALFFVRFLGLSATQVGLGLTLATGFAALLTLPLSRLGDTLGSKRLWTVCLLTDAVCFAIYPGVASFPSFLLLVTVLATSEAAGATSRGAYTISVLPPEQRVPAFAWVRSAFNLGFAIGAGLSALLVAIVSVDRLSVLPWTMSALLFVSVAMVLRLPNEVTRSGSDAVSPRRRRSVLRDIPFLRLAFLVGIQNADEPLLLIVAPLWLAGLDGVPDIMVPLVIVTNTAVVIVAQVPMSRGISDVAGGVKAAITAGWLLGMGCVVLLGSGLGFGISVTVASLVVAVLLLSFGEIKSSASGWILTAELSPEDSRTEYQAAWRLTGQFWRVVTPAAGVALISAVGSSGWVVFAVLFALSGYGVRAASVVYRQLGKEGH